MAARNPGGDAETQVQPATGDLVEQHDDPELGGPDGAELEPRPPSWPAGTPPNIQEAWPSPSDMKERPLEWPRPPQVSGAIDVAAFIKAQSAFVNEQSGFLRDGRLAGGDEFVHNLSQYSLAQDDYIHALHGILIQLGVM